MTTPKDTGGPAFPIADPFSVKGPKTEAEAMRLRDDMTLRDHFAGLAMQSYLTSPDSNEFECKQWADAAYLMADAMLEARK